MTMSTLCALLLPFLGTALGAAAVYLPAPPAGSRRLSGFAAGVMTAASVWSLILPALERSAGLGMLAFAPAGIGVWCGFWFLRKLEPIAARLGGDSLSGEGILPALAVALHNLPEGMAVGAAAADSGGGSSAAVTALAVGIALQNLPEGAVVSLPLRAGGLRRGRAFGWGVASGAVEPLGAAVMLLLARPLAPAMPFLLSFSAGAMLSVSAGELLPEAAREDKRGIPAFAAGFILMMALDVALGG